METIEIKPNNSRVKLAAETLRLKNQFVGLGFKRRAFVSIVREITGSFEGSQGEAELIRFWNFRFFDKKMNDTIDSVLQKINTE